MHFILCCCLLPAPFQFCIIKCFILTFAPVSDVVTVKIKSELLWEIIRDLTSFVCNILLLWSSLQVTWNSVKWFPWLPIVWTTLCKGFICFSPQECTAMGHLISLFAGLTHAQEMSLSLVLHTCHGWKMVMWKWELGVCARNSAEGQGVLVLVPSEEDEAESRLSYHFWTEAQNHFPCLIFLFLHLCLPQLYIVCCKATFARSCNHTARALFVVGDSGFSSWASTSGVPTDPRHHSRKLEEPSSVAFPAASPPWCAEQSSLPSSFSCRECSSQEGGQKTPSGAEVWKTKQDSHKGMEGHCSQHRAALLNLLNTIAESC